MTDPTTESNTDRPKSIPDNSIRPNVLQGGHNVSLTPCRNVYSGCTNCSWYNFRILLPC